MPAWLVILLLAAASIGLAILYYVFDKDDPTG